MTSIKRWIHVHACHVKDNITGSVRPFTLEILQMTLKTKDVASEPVAWILQVRAHFRPEFVNRVDDFVVFDGLSKGQIKFIVKLQAKRVAERLAVKKMKLQLDETAEDYLVVRASFFETLIHQNVKWSPCQSHIRIHNPIYRLRLQAKDLSKDFQALIGRFSPCQNNTAHYLVAAIDWISFRAP